MYYRSISIKKRSVWGREVCIASRSCPTPDGRLRNIRWNFGRRAARTERCILSLKPKYAFVIAIDFTALVSEIMGEACFRPDELASYLYV